MRTSGSRGRNGSVRERIVDSLCASIYSGKLRPGDPLLELQLAGEFQVSQTPVREALFHLERMGLVRRFPNKGTIVTQLSSAEVRERVELRRTLEIIAATQAGMRMNAQGIAELQQRVDAISQAMKKNDYFGSSRADLDFHRCIWKIAANQTLYEVLDNLAAPLFAFISIVRSRRRDNLRRVVHSHQKILDALKEGDPAAIRAVITAHFTQSYEQFFATA